MRAISKSGAIKDDVLRYLTIVRSLALSLWLSNDALVWFHAIGFRNYDNIKDITQRANRFWLVGAACGVLGDLYRLQQNGIQMERSRAIVDSGDDEKKVVSYGALVAQRKDLQYQTMQDMLEATLAGTLLNYVDMEPGTFAIVGFVATALGFRTQWKAVNG
jgi:peroxin-11B